MDDERISEIVLQMRKQSSDELRLIWVTNDHKMWTEEAFSAVKQILDERGEQVPSQEFVIESQCDTTALKQRIDRATIALYSGLIGLLFAVFWCTFGGAIGYSTHSGVEHFGNVTQYWSRSGFNALMPIALGSVAVALVWSFVAWRLLKTAQCALKQKVSESIDV